MLATVILTCVLTTTVLCNQNIVFPDNNFNIAPPPYLAAGVQGNRVLNGTQSPTIRTPLGQVTGSVYVTKNGFPMHAYLSVPYSEIPEKFGKPIPKMPWSGVYDASRMPAGCTDLESQRGSSEDCHYLKILVPTNRNGLLPVMFWPHGGGFVGGSYADYDLNAHGEYLVSKGVILVQPNYRKGALAFWSTGTDDAPGNYAFWDSLEALRFTKRHIMNFGGDPNQITLIGQGAGAVVTSVLSLSPLARGLYSKTAQFSGTVFSPLWHLRADVYEEENKRFASATGCDDPQNSQWNGGNFKEIVDCMRRLDFGVITNADRGRGKSWQPMIPDGQYGILPQSLDELALQRPALPALQGTTRDEFAWDLLILTAQGNFDPQSDPPVPQNLGQVNSASGTDNVCRTEIKPDQFENAQAMQELCSIKYSQIPQAREQALKQNVNAGIPQISRHNPIINSNDSRQPGDPFFWLQQSVQVGSSYVYHAPAMLDLAYHLAKQNKYAYLFSYDYFRQEAGAFWQVTGAFHNSDILLIEDFGVSGGFWGKFKETEQDKAVRQTLLNMITNFVKFGNPSPSPREPFYALRPMVDYNYFSIDYPVSKMKSCFHIEDVLFWNQLVPLITGAMANTTYSIPWTMPTCNSYFFTG